MLTKENVKQLVRGFLHEACGYLGIDDSQIGIIYMPMPVQMMVALLKEADDIVIDTNLLAKVVEQNTYTNIVLQERYISAESIKQKELRKI